MEAFVHRAFRGARPDAVLSFDQRRATAAAQAQAHPDILGFRSGDAKARVALGIDLRIRLARLVQTGGFEILQRGGRSLGSGGQRRQEGYTEECSFHFGSIRLVFWDDPNGRLGSGLAGAH